MEIKHLLSKLSIYKGAGTQVFGYHSYSYDKETDLFVQTDFLTTDLYNKILSLVNCYC